MKSKTFTTVRDAEHVISRANGRQSVEQILIDSAVVTRVKAGTVLGKVTATGRYKPLNTAGADGTEVPAAINVHNEDPMSPAAHIRTAADVRDCEVNGHKIFWPAGITNNQKAAAEAVLAGKGVLVRY